MRVIYLVSNEWCCLYENTLYKKGDIVFLPEKIALEYIDLNFVKPFEYSISDSEILEIFKRFNDTDSFQQQVDLFIELGPKINMDFKRNINIVLDDGNRLDFDIDPITPGDWLYFNNSLVKLYQKYDIFHLDGLKRDFKKTIENFPFLEKRVETELNYIKEYIQKSDIDGLSYWYKEVVMGRVPSNQDEYETFLSQEIKYGIEVFLHAKAVAELEGLLLSPDSIQNLKKNKKVQFNSLEDAFSRKEDYIEIMRLLVDNDYCDKRSHYWKDEKGGKKSTLASLLKQLHHKGYLKRKLSTEEIMSISKTTFGIEISDATIRHTEADKEIFDFIP